MPFRKPIAIIGGLGPHAGAYALSALLKMAERDFKAQHDHEYPEVLLHSVAFRGSDQTGLVDGVQIQAQMADSLARLERAGAQLALIACNSSHVFLEALQERTSIDIVSLIESVASEIASASQKRFAVVSSASTRASGIYRRQIEAAGKLFIETPDSQQAKLNDVIGRCMTGRFTDNLAWDLAEVCVQLIDGGAEKIVLGCTELSWLASEFTLPVPVLDSLRSATRQVLTKSSKG